MAALECPKCNRLRQTTDHTGLSQCAGCGIVFAKYQAEQMRLQEVSAAASLASARGARKDESNRVHPILTVAAVGAAFIAAFAYGKWSSSSSDSPSADINLQKFDAQYHCKEFVSARLKAPSTASFSSPSTAGSGEGPYTVHGVVDSQNSFGAMLRSSYTCTVQFAGKKVELLSLAVN